MSVAAAERQFHVLAVDDSLTDRKLIERLLRNSSYQVTTVDSGSKALELLGLLGEQAGCPSVSSYQQKIEVNLIITDYCMPGMTGYDLLKKIKESESKKDIPVVIMSSEYTPSRINRCLEGGAEEFFMKPVQLSDMKKLRPYILKGKSRDDKESVGQLQPESQAQSQPQMQSQSQSQPQLDLQKQSNFIGSVTTSICSNKRKAVDEGHSPQRTRARYTNPDNLTMV